MGWCGSGCRIEGGGSRRGEGAAERGDEKKGAPVVGVGAPCTMKTKRTQFCGLGAWRSAGETLFFEIVDTVVIDFLAVGVNALDLEVATLFAQRVFE